jgi:hypothetical protein
MIGGDRSAQIFKIVSGILKKSMGILFYHGGPSRKEVLRFELEDLQTRKSNFYNTLYR